jgi:hypothetical protein
VAVSCLRHGPQRRIKLRVKHIASLVLASGKHFCDRSARCGAPNAAVSNSRDVLRHQLRKVHRVTGRMHVESQVLILDVERACGLYERTGGVYHEEFTRHRAFLNALSLPKCHYLSHRQQPPRCTDELSRSRCFDTLGKSRCPRAGRPERHCTFLSMNLFPCSPRTDL